MFKSSRYTVVFPTNGLRLSGTFTFQPGITAVTGRNGKGKTFGISEVWRFLLFGKKALRGPAGDYKKLEAQGVFSVRGVEYAVERTPKGESITCGDEILAVGAEAVTKKVSEILGYGLEVFDVANAALQKQSNKLSELTPAKRKELIDEVVGLKQNERVEKECKDKAKVLKLQSEATLDATVKPERPKKPKGYRPSAEIGDELSKVREVEQRIRDLTALTQTGMVPPTPPDSPRMNLEEVQAHCNCWAEAEILRNQYRSQLDMIPTTTYSKDELKAAEAWVQYDAELARRGTKPELALDAVQTGLAAWQEIFALEKISKEVTCPKCHHAFVPSQNTPPKPNQPFAWFEEQLRRHSVWSKELVEPDGKRIPVNELREAQVAYARSADRDALLAKLAALPTLTDRTEELALARENNRAWDIYEAQMESCREHETRVKGAQRELKTLSVPKIGSTELDAKFVEARVYESGLESFDRLSKRHKENLEKAAALKKDSDGFVKGAKALAEARREMKAYLAPSLSRIASSLIFEMTEGHFRKVVVDEDMEITVDGQSINTLSGAQSTAANLALRLALGQVLVASVFPVFIGDEIDADMDDDYAQATADCFIKMKKRMDQIILITHGELDNIDHVIDLNP